MQTVADSRKGVNTPRPDGLARTLDRAVGNFSKSYPTHAALIGRARAVYEDGKIHLTSSTSTVDGSDGNTYTLMPVGKGCWSCTCPAYQHTPALVNGVVHCKHTLALRLLFHVEGGW